MWHNCGGLRDSKVKVGEVVGEGPHILGDMEGQSLPVQVHICPKCGTVELTATEQTGARLLSRKGLKRCIECGAKIPLASEVCLHCGVKQGER